MKDPMGRMLLSYESPPKCTTVNALDFRKADTRNYLSFIKWIWGSDLPDRQHKISIKE